MSVAFLCNKDSIMKVSKMFTRVKKKVIKQTRFMVASFNDGDVQK